MGLNAGWSLLWFCNPEASYLQISWLLLLKQKKKITKVLYWIMKRRKERKEDSVIATQASRPTEWLTGLATSSTSIEQLPNNNNNNNVLCLTKD